VHQKTTGKSIARQIEAKVVSMAKRTASSVSLAA
jgi:hypothetical protein